MRGVTPESVFGDAFIEFVTLRTDALGTVWRGAPDVHVLLQRFDGFFPGDEWLCVSANDFAWLGKSGECNYGELPRTDLMGFSQSYSGPNTDLS